MRNAGWSDIVECSEEETKTFQIGLLTLIWKSVNMKSFVFMLLEKF